MSAPAFRTGSHFDETPAVPAPAPGSADLIGAVARYRRDQEVFGQGAPATHVYKVLSGSVRCFSLLSDGRRQITSFYLPGDVFGLETGADHRVTAEAVADCAVIVARRATMGDQPGAASWLGKLLLRELSRCQDHMLTLGRRCAAERVSRFLTDLADRLGRAESFELPMSRQDIADFLGLTIETVSRTITHLTSLRLIELQGSRTVVLCNRPALSALCE
jgi:CRP/FNR family nitrogen fixation transcriptional regulator